MNERWRGLFGEQGFPQDCLEMLCETWDVCLLEGCRRLKERAEQERRERLLREARAL